MSWSLNGRRCSLPWTPWSGRSCSCWSVFLCGSDSALDACRSATTSRTRRSTSAQLAFECTDATVLTLRWIFCTGFVRVLSGKITWITTAWYHIYRVRQKQVLFQQRSQIYRREFKMKYCEFLARCQLIGYAVLVISYSRSFHSTVWLVQTSSSHSQSLVTYLVFIPLSNYTAWWLVTWA